MARPRIEGRNGLMDLMNLMEGDGLKENARHCSDEKLNLNVMLIATRNLCNSEFMKRSTALQSASYRNAQSSLLDMLQT